MPKNKPIRNILHNLFENYNIKDVVSIMFLIQIS